MKILILMTALFWLVACGDGQVQGDDVKGDSIVRDIYASEAGIDYMAADIDPADNGSDSARVDSILSDNETGSFAVAIVAGGCFWGIEDKMKKLDGVIDTDVGYCGGTTENPTYNLVSTGNTGHAESVRVLYNPSVIAFDRLIAAFLKTHDPTVSHPLSGYGSQYRSVVFFMNERERGEALNVIAELEESGTWTRPILTEVVEAGTFWMAEEYHQDYLEKKGY